MPAQAQAQAQIQINEWCMFVEFNFIISVRGDDDLIIPQAIKPDSKPWFVISKKIGRDGDGDDMWRDIIVGESSKKQMIYHDVVDVDGEKTVIENKPNYRGSEATITDDNKVIINKIIEICMSIGEEVYRAGVQNG